jgi:hypothetical protein
MALMRTCIYQSSVLLVRIYRRGWSEVLATLIRLPFRLFRLWMMVTTMMILGGYDNVNDDFFDDNIARKFDLSFWFLII